MPLTAEETKSIVDALAAKMVQTPTPVTTNNVDYVKLGGIFGTMAVAAYGVWQSGQKPTGPPPPDPVQIRFEAADKANAERDKLLAAALDRIKTLEDWKATKK